MNITIQTKPTGRSPDKKWFFGKRAEGLDFTRPKYNRVGDDADYQSTFKWVYEHETTHDHELVFKTSGFTFRVCTNDERHAQFVRNMFTVVDKPYEHTADWTIYHNTDIMTHPAIYVNLDEQVMIIIGTTFMGEIKKGVFGILGFELPERGILPMHCAAFTGNDDNMSTCLMFGLSGTGKTTLSSDPNFNLISDDEVIWLEDGIEWIEQGCYAKSEGLTPETHPTIFDAVETARDAGMLVEENPGAANARLCYPLGSVEGSYADMAPAQLPFDNPDHIFFLTMDATGTFPPISRISGETVRKFFETGYTSQMPGTEAGDDEIKKVLSPCYGSPFMPRPVKEYSDMLMERIEKYGSNVYLVNTGMDHKGHRFALPFTRMCIKDAMDTELPDNSEEILNKLLTLLSE